MQSNCDRCYRRKGKCDKLQPCGSCHNAGKPCVYTDKVRRRKFSEFEMERLEKRLQQAEARNRDLVDELTKERTKERTKPQRHNDRPALTEPIRSEEQPCQMDAVSEVSYLSINAAGERQPYLGSTSGLLLADLVRSSLDASVVGSSMPKTSDAAQNASTASPVKSIPDRSVDLPAKAVTLQLIAAYLEHDAIAYPFLHVVDLLNLSERIYQDETYYSSRATAYEVFVFNMVLATSTANVYKYDWHMLPSAEAHHRRAMSELNAVLIQGGLPCLQAILLLCQYRQGSSLKDNSASMWHLVGIAARIGLELGLHRESAYPLAREELALEQTERYRQQEVARRAFWCLIAMDRMTSNILGRPHAIRHDDIDAEEPNEEDDILHMPRATSDAAPVNKTAVFNCIIRYRLLCGKIMTTLHRRRDRYTTLAEALKIRETLADDLDTWFAGVIDVGLPSTRDNSATPQRSCFLSMTWFRVIYANAELMIWRPCPLLTDLSNDMLSLRKVYESSAKSITAYAELHKSGVINYSWVTLHSTFLAGLSFIYAVGRHLRGRMGVAHEAPCLLDKDPSTLEIVSMSRACSKVLVAVAERWNARRHCHEVIDRLSDAVLIDAMKVQSGRFARQQTRDPPTPASSMSHNQVRTTPNAAADASYPAMMAQNDAGNDCSLAVDSEFLQCFDYLHSLDEHQKVEDPILYLTQDWMGYLSTSNGAYDVPGAGVDGMFTS